MQVFERYSDAGDAFRGAALAIGNFDGLHRGHRALFDAARDAARPDGRTAILTFEPHPGKVLSPQLAPSLLLTPTEKLEGFEALGVDAVLAQRFDAEFAATPPGAFVDDVLLGVLGVGHVVVGGDFHFGQGGLGDVQLLERHLQAAGVGLTVVPPIKEGGLVCSSSKIRQFVTEGRVAAAARLLGAPYWLRGRVVRGDRRGRELGFPTANLETARETLPRLGVYATIAELDDGARFDAVTNVGLRPTFRGDGVRIEAHLLDFPPAGGDGDLYDRPVTLHFVDRVRDERKFHGPDALREQIGRDVDAARALLG